MPLMLFILFSGRDYFTCQKTSPFDSTCNIFGFRYLCDNWIILFDKELDLLRVSNKCTMYCTGCWYMVVSSLVLNSNCFPRYCNFLWNSHSTSMWCQIHDLALNTVIHSWPYKIFTQQFFITLIATELNFENIHVHIAYDLEQCAKAHPFFCFEVTASKFLLFSFFNISFLPENCWCIFIFIIIIFMVIAIIVIFIVIATIIKDFLGLIVN